MVAVKAEPGRVSASEQVVPVLAVAVLHVAVLHGEQARGVAQRGTERAEGLPACGSAETESARRAAQDPAWVSRAFDSEQAGVRVLRIPARGSDSLACHDAVARERRGTDSLAQVND